MSHVAQAELEQLIGHDTSGVGETKQAVISEYGMQTHSPGVQKSFVAEIAQGCMAVDDLDLLPNKDLP